jgi:DNA-binding transcriptional regulator of glucitol operon
MIKRSRMILVAIILAGIFALVWWQYQRLGEGLKVFPATL